jgi:membrane-associated phospholipid phosphatase
MTMHEKSWTAALQLTESIVAAQAATELLKRTVHEERPNRSDDLSFPSGHASGAFSGAMFVHKRYGWKAAIPPYIMAGVVGWSRVQARAHYWHDVLGGAAVSALFTWVLVDSENSLSVSADTSGAQLNFSFKF